MSIKVLSPQVAAKIAAGEVVERPASVVKELLENALDAGAGQIAIETKGGGLESIRITDDGSGIAAEDVETAFGRYATSKITSVEDLDSITTLGFRGEALASIAAVAQVDLATGSKEGTVGDALTLKEGLVVRHVQQARPHGTTITVRDLFRNVPARLKFLKSTATENSHIANVVSQYALAYPEVRFFLEYATAVPRCRLRAAANYSMWSSKFTDWIPPAGCWKSAAAKSAGRTGRLCRLQLRAWSGRRL